MREAWLLTDGRHEPANAQSNRAGHMTVFPFERFDDADSIQDDSLSRSSLEALAKAYQAKHSSQID